MEGYANVNFGTSIIGLLALGFGISTLVIRIRTPERFAKLQTMKEQLGEKAAYRLHFTAYTVIPIMVGIIFLLGGVFGVSLRSF